MKKNQKKIFAREFLFLLGTIILFVIIIISWQIIIEIKNNQEQKLSTEINNLKQNEEVPYRFKIYDYLQNNLKNEPWNNFEQQSEFLTKSKDSIFASELYENLKKAKKMNFTKTEFISGLNKDSISEQYLNRKLTLENSKVTLEKELRKVRGSFFNNHISNEYLYRLVLILFSISFLLRYLIYGALWSINQLREEKN